MRNLLYIVFIFFLGKALGQNNAANTKDSLDQKQGYWIIYGKDKPELQFPSDGKVEEGNYINDRKEGLWIKYHEDGATPKLKGEYRNNRPNGKYSKYWPNGRTKEIGTFHNNLYYDSLKRYYENGQLEHACWYDENGKQQGRVNTYYSSGQLEFTFCARDGVPYDAFHYDQSGKVLSSQATPTVCGGPVYKPAEPKQLVSPEEAKKYPRPEISETPNTRGIAFKKDGYNKIYRDDNEIFLDGVFKNGQLLDGKYYVYDSDGILLLVRIYKNSVYHSDGQL